MDWKCVQGIFQTLETLLRYGVGKTNSWVHHSDFFILFVSRSGESERKLYQAGSDFLCGLCAPTLLRRSRLHGSHCSWSPMVMAACCGPCGSLSTNGTMHSQPPSDWKWKSLGLTWDASCSGITMDLKKKTMTRLPGRYVLNRTINKQAACSTYTDKLMTKMSSFMPHSNYYYCVLLLLLFHLSSNICERTIVVGWAELLWAWGQAPPPQSGR